MDLNRDFPDHIKDPVNTVAGRAPEVARVMEWTWGRDFDLSLNYHGGALVANYGYDGNASGSPVYTIAPDDALFIQLALLYPSHNGPMYASSTFSQGITNGADWYVIYGGMQDWCYVWAGGVVLTLEVRITTWPAENTLPSYWANNRESLLLFVESSLKGIRGIVRNSATQQPVAATVRLVGIACDDFSSAELGDYHRLIVPGTWSLEVSARGTRRPRYPASWWAAVRPRWWMWTCSSSACPKPSSWRTSRMPELGPWRGGWQIGPTVAGSAEHGFPDSATDTGPGSDNRILGYALGADYPNGMAQTEWATSPAWDLSGWQGVHLDFRRRLGLERNLYDHGYLQGWKSSTWVTLWENSSTTISENAWSTQTYDVSALADGNPAFRLRFSMGTTDSAWRYCGWNLDDLHISVTATVPPDSPVLTIQKAGPDIELSWPAMAGSASYWIERDPRLDTPFTLLLATSATGHTLSGEAGTTGCWLYRVIAIH